MADFDVVDAEWRELDEEPTSLALWERVGERAQPGRRALGEDSLSLALSQRERGVTGRARLAQSRALSDRQARRFGGRRVSRPAPRLQPVPNSLQERARAVERDFLDTMLGRPLPPCPPLRSI